MKSRLLNASFWIVAGAAYWLFQIQPGLADGPGKGAALELTVLGVFAALALFYAWLGHWRQGGSPAVITALHAVLGYGTATLLSPPVRQDWVVDLVGGPNGTKASVANTHEGYGLVALALFLAWLIVQLRHKFAHRDGDESLLFPLATKDRQVNWRPWFWNR